MDTEKLRKIIMNRTNEAIGRTGKTIYQVAIDAEMEPRVLYNYTTSRRKGSVPSTRTLIKLADALDVSLDWLCGRTDDES